MWRMAVAATVVASWCAVAWGQAEEAIPEPKPKAPTLRTLTSQAEGLEQAIRQTTSHDARKRLLERLEMVRHQMGPTDAAGRRVHCQAMWHDRALEQLERDVTRLSPGAAEATRTDGRTLVCQARLQVRRMAQACLTHGWRLAAVPEKYQVDVFGQYLANNLATTDGLLQRLTSLPPAEAEGEGAAADPASRRARILAGLARMTRAADTLAAAGDGADPKALVPPLGEFVAGLDAVHAAVEGLKAPTPEEGDPSATEPPDDGPPPMTEAEKQRIAEIRQTAASLTDAEWADVKELLDRYAAMIEAGFTVPSARPKVREMLGQIGRTTTLVRGLTASRVVPAEYVASCQKRLTKYLGYVGQASLRADAYTWLTGVWDHDATRRRIEGQGLPDNVASGLLYAYYVLQYKQNEAQTSAGRKAEGDLWRACKSILGTMDRMAAWPPAGMDPRLKACYDRQAGVFHRSVETAVAVVKGDASEAVAAFEAADNRGDDLALLIRAESVVQAIKTYRPSQAGAMYARMIQAAQGLAQDPRTVTEARRDLYRLVRPFEDLESFPTPDPADRRALSRLLGRTYTVAVTKLSRELGAGINAAAAGDPRLLARALRCKALFRLARKRARAERGNLNGVSVSNLAPFSVPADVWMTFRSGVDRQLKAMFADYVRGAEDADWYAMPGALESVYGPVLAGQRLTVEARSPGEPPMGFLLRNLGRAAVTDPSAKAQNGWVVGYHAVEAAVATLAELDGVAGWHRGEMRRARGYLDQVDLVPDGKPVAGR